MALRGGLHTFLAFGAALALSGCLGSPMAPRSTEVTPVVRPATVGTEPVAAMRAPSAASRALAQYYLRVQRDLLARGLLRTDGGGPDTAYTDTMLVRNFAAIALEDEYERGGGLRPSRGSDSAIKKWTRPIRMTTEFTPGVPKDQIDENRREVSGYAARLARITGHPISMVDARANFYVLYMSEDDRDAVTTRIRQIVPGVNASALRIIETFPRGIHCLVMAFSETPGGYDYGTAIAVIRTEHPSLLRRTCVHEELAQGMGLGNDSPRARPSIFNDDDEFALLTTHDEMLLKILYDARLKPGMSAEEALPIVRAKAADLMGSGGPN
jgi:hypothetical protein